MVTMVRVIKMAIDYGTIGKRLQSRRKERNLTQEKLSEQVNITVVYLSKVENGRVHPTLELLDSLCEALDLRLSDVLTGIQTQEADFGNERAVQLLQKCAPNVKEAALDVLERLCRL